MQQFIQKAFPLAVAMVIATALTTKYPILGLLMVCTTAFYRAFTQEFSGNTIKVWALIFVAGLSFLKLSTNIGDDSVIRWLIIINVAMMAFTCIPNPFYNTDGYNNVWLALGLIFVSMCTPYIKIVNQSYTLTPSLIPVSMYFLLHTILLSYLYQATDFRNPYVVQLAVWIPLIMHFMYSNWVQARFASLMIHLLLYFSKY